MSRVGEEHREAEGDCPSGVREVNQVTTQTFSGYKREGEATAGNYPVCAR